MELTKDEAIRLHRELWDWLSKNPDKEKWDWSGWEDYSEIEVRSMQFCFACAYSKGGCDECLLEWPGIDCCDNEGVDGEGIFNIWDGSANNAERIRLAEQIRDLPVREGDI